MPLLARTILTPLSIEISNGALGRLGTVLSDSRISNGQVAVVLGSGIGPELHETIAATLPFADVITIAAGSLEQASALADKLKVHSYDAVVGIGGGKVIDTVKYAATQQGLPMVAVATSLAHDGLASPVSTLERNGSYLSYGVHIPIAVIVDLGLVARSPAYQIRSGIGDALSNLCAIADWELSHAVNGEPIDGLALALARTGAEAVLHHPGSIGDEEFLATLANALILGGVAMAVAGSSRPCSGACHEVTHAFSTMHPAAVSHGVGAGIGALFATFLRSRYPSEQKASAAVFDQLNATLQRHDHPRVPADVGLSSEQFAAVVQHAPSTRPGRFTILEHLQLDAGAIANAVEEYIVAVG
jgi:glycerol-1-phosphate dehydrogenase [NAD(P)+]